METKLSMLVIQNVLATCWFYIIIMCGNGIKTFFLLFFVLLIICYIIDVFSFFDTFPYRKVDTKIEAKWLANLLQ